MSRVIKGDRIRCEDDSFCLPLIACIQQNKRPNPSGDMAVPAETTDPSALMRQAEQALAKAKKESEAMIAQAQIQKEELLVQAEEACREIKEAARKEGYESGCEQGMAAGKKEAESIHNEADKLLRETFELREQMLSRVEPQVVQLSIKIAERLITRELQQQPEVIQSMVHAALRQLQETGEVIIRLHPDDVALCREAFSQWQEELPEQTTLTLMADNTMERGGCRVETRDSVIECKISERLEKLREVLMEVASHD